MIAGRRVIAVIPARGGSKAVPKKNIASLGGKPLLSWSIEAAESLDVIDRIIVSTDDEAIAAVAMEHGVEVHRRPPELATDAALVIDALRNLIETLRAEGEDTCIMVLLEPTCPFRSKDDVSTCLDELVNNDKDSVATFVEARLNPHRAWGIGETGPKPFIPGVDPWLPRQRLPEAYQLNGAVYCFWADRLPAEGQGLLFGEAGAVIMPAQRSIDIDTQADLLLAELMLAGGETHECA